jgi:endo-1,4-beta-xylanase
MKKTYSRVHIVHWQHVLFVFIALLACIGAAFGIWTMLAAPPLRSVSSADQLDLLSTGWNFVPGTSLGNDGLHVSTLDRAIVRQDGTPGQSNPPINAYGTHLQASGDMTLTADMNSIKGTAALQLNGGVPIVQDEFRVEPKGLRISLSSTSLTLSRWNSYTTQDVYNQRPAQTTSYPIQLQPRNVLSIERRGSQLTVSLNTHRIATIPEQGVLGHDIWFGVDGGQLGDSWVLGGLHAAGTSGAAVSLANSQDHTRFTPTAGTLLQSAATKKRPGFLIGAAVAASPAATDPKYGQLAFGGNFGQITTENVLKWQFIHPQPTVYDFHEADSLVAIARKNNLAVHGHTLVFGEANPAWVQHLPVNSAADKANVKQVMTDHITQVVSHFKGQVASWDVVNEPLAEDSDATNDGLRTHIWYNAMGADYITEAFRAAHQADPSAKLYINEFGLEADGSRWDKFLALVTQLKASGVPIDGVGFEAHVYQSGDEIDPATLKAHMQALARVGLASRISEMDVYADNGTDAQAQQYAGVLGACLSEPSCVSWSTWGVSDHYDLFLDDNNTVQHGTDFLWDGQYAPTPAVTALLKVLGS